MPSFKTRHLGKWLPDPDSNAKAIALLEEQNAKLMQVSGYDIEKLIELFAAGYTLKAPEPPKKMELLTVPYYTEDFRAIVDEIKFQKLKEENELRYQQARAAKLYDDAMKRMILDYDAPFKGREE